jgi:dihydropteroate synthase
VEAERRHAETVIGELPYEPGLQDKVKLQAVAWDRPGTRVPMHADKPAQRSVDLALGKPSQCDIDVAIIAGTLGAPGRCAGFIGRSGMNAPENGGLRVCRATLRSCPTYGLVHLRPDLRVPGRPEQTVLQMSQELPHHIPLWMGVVNLTPDSFSDGGKHTEWAAVEPLVEAMAEAGVHIVDLGAESTRPGASPVSAQEEWSRLQPVLERLRERWASDPLGPRTSIDTRHPEVVEKALRVGVDIVNDVSGLTCDAMICLARDSGNEWVAMHHLTIPAERGVILSEDCDPCQEVEAWLERQLERWERAGLDLGRVIFDPGIGFGKNSLQSLEILRHVSRFRRHGLRVLAGHSRKSFMKDFSALVPAERDMDTIGASLSLCRKGVDILRIHDVPRHARAYLAWAHVEQ